MKNWKLARRKIALHQRARIIQEIRHFFVHEGYLEVETPHRIPTPAPEAHIDAIPSAKWYLHTSPELCMKRLLAAGYEKIFQVCRCWREKERGSQHLPEFTLLEWYRTGADYRSLMKECERLIPAVARALGLGDQVTFKGHVVNLTPPWERVTIREVFDRYAENRLKEATGKDLFDEIMVQKIEPKLGLEKPTFLYDYPAERAALARLKPGDPTVAERFELYIGGLELANGFSELVDPEEQRKRFQKENENRKLLGKTVYSLPEKFLSEVGEVPPSAGIALGIDRLLMLFLNAPSVDDVVAFPPEEL